MFKKDPKAARSNTSGPQFPKITEYDAFEASRKKPKKVTPLTSKNVTIAPLT